MKKTLSLLLAVLLLISAFPLTAFAAETDVAVTGDESGTTGECTWSFVESTGTLTISGSGVMDDYSSLDEIPWARYDEVLGKNTCARIQNLVIEPGVEYIGSAAFGMAFNLKSVVIPEGVTEIGMNAFYGCFDLESVTLPESLEVIGKWAFIDCKFTSVTVPENVIAIGDYALGYYGMNPYYSGVPLSETEGMLFLYTRIPNFSVYGEDGSAAQTYANANGLMFNPDVLSGETGACTYTFDQASGVLTISGSGATANYSDASLQPWADYQNYVKTLIVEEGVTKLGNRLVANCMLLQSVTLPGTLKTIGVETFKNCVGLSEITLPESLTGVGQDAFVNASLTSVTIPESVTTIGTHAFGWYYNFNDTLSANPDFIIYGVEGSVAQTYAVNNGFIFNGFVSGTAGDCTWVFDAENKLLTISGSGAMPDYADYTDAPWYSYRLKICSVVIENGVTKVGDHSFMYFDNLSSISLPSTLLTVGDQAFYGCTLLKTVNIPACVTSIGERAFGYYKPYGSGGYGMVSGFTIIGSSGTAAETYALENGFTFVSYGGSVGDLNYYLDPATGTLTISGEGAMPEGYENESDIPWYGFRDEILHVVVEDGVTSVGYLSFINCKNLTDVTLGDDVSVISSAAFEGCTSLTTINLPDNLEYIFNSAFSDCTALESIEFPTQKELKLYGSAFSGSGLKSLTVPANVVLKEEQIFMHCNSLVEVTVYSETISDEAFVECENLAKAAIYSKTIGMNAFNHCEKLTDLTLCEGVETIGMQAFQWCRSLSDVTLPESLRTVYRCAFYNCSMPYVTIPEGVTKIEDLAFGYYIVNLSEFKNEAFEVYGTTDVAQNYAEKFGFAYNPIHSGTTYDCTWTFDPVTATLTISGDGEMNDYSNITEVPWARYTKLQGAENPTYHQAHIKHLVLEEGVTYIGDNCFMRTYNLESVEIPSTITAFDGFAFAESGLRTVTIPGSVETIGASAFSNCDRLTTVIIGEGVRNIGVRAFYDCDMLSSVTLPSTLKEVYSEAFFGDTALMSVYVPGGVTKIENAAFGMAINSDFNYVPVEGFVLYGVDDSLAKTYAQDSGVTFIPLSGTTGDCSWEFNREDGTLRVWGSGAMATYFDENTVPWRLLADEIKEVIIDDGVTVIGDNCFFGLDRMEDVTLPDTLTGIGNGAFSGCGALAAVDIPDGVTVIGNYAFDGCASLADITLPKSVTSVGMMAFRDTGLSGITITNPGTEIGLYAFGYDKNGNKLAGFTVAGYKNSTAQSYANNNGFEFIAVKDVIDNVVITGIAAPVAGESPDYTANVPVGAGYSVDTVYNEDGMTNGIIWNYEDNDLLFPDDEFEGGEKYHVTVRIKADEDRAFPAPENGSTYRDGELPCTLNGGNAAAVYYSEGVVYVTYTFTCEGEPELLGDVDNDGEVSVIDATLLQRFEAGFNIPISEADILRRGDVDGDEEAGVLDATYIKRYNAGFNIPYPIGDPI